jgi:ElaB/YqjD/DUF883 family membrane-anchored ribosome-binding protein
VAMEQAHTAVSNAERAVQSATETMTRVAHDAVETMRDYGERAEEQLRGATEQSREVIDKVSEYVEGHPMAALGIAAAVGFVLGALAGRRSTASEANNSAAAEAE